MDTNNNNHPYKFYDYAAYRQRTLLDIFNGLDKLISEGYKRDVEGVFYSDTIELKRLRDELKVVFDVERCEECKELFPAGALNNDKDNLVTLCEECLVKLKQKQDKQDEFERGLYENR